eukprot:13531495-Heterocapsa_arctica.AAC.1
MATRGNDPAADEHPISPPRGIRELQQAPRRSLLSSAASRHSRACSGRHIGAAAPPPWIVLYHGKQTLGSRA